MINFGFRASAQKLASPEDEAIILKNGICVIDCSWAKINEINFKTPFEHERKCLLIYIKIYNYSQFQSAFCCCFKSCKLWSAI